MYAIRSYYAYQFDSIARNLLAGHGFSIMDDAPWEPDALRTPLYPLVVAAGYTLTGCLPPWVISISAPCEPSSGPEMVPEPSRSPARRLQPLEA